MKLEKGKYYEIIFKSGNRYTGIAISETKVEVISSRGLLVEELWRGGIDGYESLREISKHQAYLKPSPKNNKDALSLLLMEDAE